MVKYLFQKIELFLTNTKSIFLQIIFFIWYIQFHKMKILVGLSWWVDSAVTAHLLLKQWHDVVWWFMKNYVEENWNCTTREDAESTIAVAKHLGIKLKVFDFQKEYKDRILNYIFDWYKKWITPNPDILCNNLIKFDLFLEEALNLWFDKIATWHYARISQNNNWIYKLLRWKDYNKDQSYFLSWLNQKQLSKSLFPIWDFDKPKIREIANQINLPNANRKDSQWLCFVWNIPIKDFLMKKLPQKWWNIIDESWNILWKHDWAWFFTIWQNRWLKLPHKAYVYKIDVKNNIVYVSKNKESSILVSKICNLENWHRIWKNYNLPTKIKAKIRYRQEPQLWELDNKNWQFFVNFEEEQRAIAPWQSIVAYIDDECIWSGIISKSVFKS